MEEEHEELPAPPRFRNKIFKIMTLTVFFLGLFFFLSFAGLKGTSSSEFCSSCHEMEPEYFTWKASTHSEVDCVSCHIEPGLENLAKSKAGGVVELYKKTTKTYTAPIQMPKDIPDSACKKCHNMDSRQVTPSGDLIIPHDKHMEKDIKCTQCHSGVAHGKIAERNVTFKSDYEKWDNSLGKSMMGDIKFTSPKMETCMECHEARDVSTTCKTCHTTEMVPKSHKENSFKMESHGPAAIKDVSKCDSCHGYMSKEEIKDMKEVPASQQFVENGVIENKSLPAQDYAKENTFCKDCHITRPPSHVNGYVNLHGSTAKKGTEKCLACHDLQKTGFNKTTNVKCSSCHPANHGAGTFKERHPIDLNGINKPNDSCYTCHNKQRCASCHKQ